MLGARFLLQERRLSLLVVFAYFCVCGTEVVDSAHIDLSRRVLSQVVHDVVSHIFDSSVAAERDATDRIHSDVIKQRDCHRVSDVLEYFLGEGRTVCVGVYLRVRISYGRLLLDVALALDKFRRKRVNPLSVMVVALKRVAVGQARRLLERDTTTAIATHAVLVLNRHDLLGKVALIHIKIKTVHRNQFCKSDVVRLPLVFRQSVAKNEDAFLGSMGVEVHVHLEVLVHGCVLADGLFRSPNRGLIAPVRLVVKPVQVLAERVKSVVAACNTIWIQRRYNLKHVVLSQKAALLTL